MYINTDMQVWRENYCTWLYFLPISGDMYLIVTFLTPLQFLFVEWSLEMRILCFKGAKIMYT